MKKKSAAQLDREIAAALGTAKAKRGTQRVHLVGLMDGIHTAGTGFYLRKMKELGATVKLAKTGRLTVRDASGTVTIYTVDAPQNRAQADELLARDPNPESPLSRAYADLTR